MLSTTEPTGAGFTLVNNNTVLGDFLRKIEGYNVTIKFKNGARTQMDYDKFNALEFPEVVGYCLNFPVVRRDTSVNESFILGDQPLGSSQFSTLNTTVGHDISISERPLDSPHFSAPLGAVNLGSAVKLGSPMVRDQSTNDDQEIFNHPLYQIFMAAILQAMHGKGERHGGTKVPFMQQPWVERARLHGRGFLTGQADKKIGEAASTRDGEAFETEMLGAMVYAGMAIIYERNKKEEKKE